MPLDDKKDAKKILGFADSLNSELKTDYKGAFYYSVNPGQNEKEEQENNFNKTESDIELNKITYKIKLVFVGDSNVGKTSIINRYCENKFEEKGIIATISVAFKNKKIQTDPFTEVNMDIWDTAGQEKYKAMTRGYLRDSHGIFFVFDLSNKKSFDSLTSWLEVINDSDVRKNCVKILIGNKLDFIKREVDKEIGNKFAEENGMKYMEVSAKEGINIDAMFEAMGTDCAKILQEEFDENNRTYDLKKSKRKEEKEEIKNSILSIENFNKEINKEIKSHSCC